MTTGGLSKSALVYLRKRYIWALSNSLLKHGDEAMMDRIEHLIAAWFPKRGRK